MIPATMRQLRHLGGTWPRQQTSSIPALRATTSRQFQSEAGQPRFDQTHESNDPSKGVAEKHKAQCKQGPGDHPAKQPDPQQAPSKSTGVRRDGPDSKAGEGEDRGVTVDEKVKKPMGRPRF
ncbi:hypothetical protein GGS20DRAFT_527898 [Poronia punctata]|nr:hypothetical protein GGS20DRAFT_527898 [Poronia punctata]